MTVYEAPKLNAANIPIDAPQWDAVPKSPPFVNIVNGKRALYETRVAVAWTDADLYVRYWAEEPFLTSTLETRDSLLFAENNVELFIDGGDVYYELEVNARNVVYEVLFAWQDVWEEVAARFPELDPLAPGAYTFGGNNDRQPRHFWQGTHPRGLRWAFTNWDLPGLETDVRLHGTLNDDSDRDQGWDALVKIPWDSLTRFGGPGRAAPPDPGDVWHFQFARYERLEELDTSVGWAWTPVGDPDNHAPEKFTPIRFVN